MESKRLELYLLINNISKTEKAYFKKFGFKYIKEVKPELELFDLINKRLNKNDISVDLEDTVKAQFLKNQPNLNFIKIKNSLFKRLLATLSEYDKKDDNRAILQQQYNEANALLKRNLPKTSLRIINKAKEATLQNEDALLGIMFDELAFMCAVMLNDKEHIKETYTSRYKYINELESQLQLNEIYENVYDLHRTQGVGRKGKISKDLNQIVAQTKKFNLKNKSNKFKFNFYSLLKLIAYLKNDNKEIIRALENMKDIAQISPQMFKRKDKLLIGMYADLINHSIEINDNSYYNTYYKTIAEWESTQPDVLSYAKTQAIRSKIASLTLRQEYKEVALLEKKYLKHKVHFDDLLQLAINDCFILSFYCLGDCKKVIEYVNLQFKIKELRMDIQLSAEFILLVIYFEEQHFDILQSSIKSIENRMKNKSESILKSEKIILDFFKNNVAAKRKPIKEIAQKSLDDLKAIEYKALSNSFDFKIWLQSLIDKASYKNTLGKD